MNDELFVQLSEETLAANNLIADAQTDETLSRRDLEKIRVHLTAATAAATALEQLAAGCPPPKIG